MCIGNLGEDLTLLEDFQNGSTGSALVLAFEQSPASLGSRNITTHRRAMWSLNQRVGFDGLWGLIHW
jgi:hypothetical protein